MGNGDHLWRITITWRYNETPASLRSGRWPNCTGIGGRFYRNKPPSALAFPILVLEDLVQRHAEDARDPEGQSERGHILFLF